MVATLPIKRSRQCSHLALDLPRWSSPASLGAAARALVRAAFCAGALATGRAESREDGLEAEALEVYQQKKREFPRKVKLLVD